MPSITALYPNVPSEDLNASMIFMRANREDARLTESRMPVQNPLDVLATACSIRADYESDNDTIVDEDAGSNGDSAKFSTAFLKSSVESRVSRLDVILRLERPIVLTTFVSFTQEGDSVEEGAARAMLSIKYFKTAASRLQDSCATIEQDEGKQTPIDPSENERAPPVMVWNALVMEHVYDLSSMREMRKKRWSLSMSPPEMESASAEKAKSSVETIQPAPHRPRQKLVWTTDLPPPPSAAPKRAKPLPKTKAEKELDTEAKEGIWKSKFKQRNTRNNKDCEVDGHQEGFVVDDTGAVKTSGK